MTSHFGLLVVFSALVSIVFTFISKDGARERFKYFIVLFGSFVVLSFLAGWLMYPLPL